jgi:hypothetical protein
VEEDDFSLLLGELSPLDSGFDSEEAFDPFSPLAPALSLRA